MLQKQIEFSLDFVRTQIGNKEKKKKKKVKMLWAGITTKNKQQFYKVGQNVTSFILLLIVIYKILVHSIDWSGEIIV